MKNSRKTLVTAADEIMRHLMKARFKFIVLLLDLTSPRGERRRQALMPPTPHIRVITHGKAAIAEIRQAYLTVQKKKVNEDMMHLSTCIVKMLNE